MADGYVKTNKLKTYQIPEFQNVEHLKITSSLSPLQLGYIFPETINT